MHFGIFDVKGCSNSGTSCRWTCHCQKDSWPSMILCFAPFKSEFLFQYNLWSMYLYFWPWNCDVLYGSGTWRSSWAVGFLKTLANSNKYILLKQRAVTSVLKLKVCDTVLCLLEKKPKCLSTRMIQLRFPCRETKLTWTDFQIHVTTGLTNSSTSPQNKCKIWWWRVLCGLNSNHVKKSVFLKNCGIHHSCVHVTHASTLF